MDKGKKNAATSRDEATFWNEAMDDALIDAFVYQHEMGNRVNGSFTSKAYDDIVKEISTKFPDKKFDKERIKNRIKYIKKGFGACYDLFKNLSGFSWNSETCRWCAEPEVWDKLIEAHPDAKAWRRKPIRNYEKLKLLYGFDLATGDEAETPREMRERMRNEQAKNRPTITIDEIDRMVFNDEVRLEGYDNPADNINTPPLQNQDEGVSFGKKRRRKVSKNEDIDSMRESFEAVANAITKAASELVKSQEVHEVPKSEIWKLLEELGFDDELEMDEAYIFLIDHPNKLDGILSCPPNRRKNLLLKMMK